MCSVCSSNASLFTIPSRHPTHFVQSLASPYLCHPYLISPRCTTINPLPRHSNNPHTSIETPSSLFAKQMWTPFWGPLLYPDAFQKVSSKPLIPVLPASLQPPTYLAALSVCLPRNYFAILWILAFSFIFSAAWLFVHQVSWSPSSSRPTTYLTR